jgi:hypothetical protein
MLQEMYSFKVMTNFNLHHRYETLPGAEVGCRFIISLPILAAISMVS